MTTKKALEAAGIAVLFVAMVFAAYATSRMFPHKASGCFEYNHYSGHSSEVPCETVGSATVFASTLLSEVFLFAIWKVGDAFGLNAAPGPSMKSIRKYIPSARTAVIALAIAGVAGGVFAAIRDGNARAKVQADAVAWAAHVKWLADADKEQKLIDKAYKACARKYSTESDAVEGCTGANRPIDHD